MFFARFSPKKVTKEQVLKFCQDSKISLRETTSTHPDILVTKEDGTTSNNGQTTAILEAFTTLLKTTYEPNKVKYGTEHQRYRNFQQEITTLSERRFEIVTGVIKDKAFIKSLGEKIMGDFKSWLHSIKIENLDASASKTLTDFMLPLLKALRLTLLALRDDLKLEEANQDLKLLFKTIVLKKQKQPFKASIDSVITDIDQFFYSLSDQKNASEQILLCCYDESLYIRKALPLARTEQKAEKAIEPVFKSLSTLLEQNKKQKKL